MISVNGLYHSYTKNENYAISNVSFEVGQGEIVGFVGKNGAGKSTTIRAMVNMIFPTKGKISIGGLDATTHAKHIKEFLGYMSSDCALYDNVSSRELFRLCVGFSDVPIEKAFELAKYFELNLDKKISQLSLGNRKKVSIIQSLLKDSKVLILDEPTNGLDPLMQSKFFDLILKKKGEGAAVFLSSHNLSEIEKYCDKVIIIKDGVIVERIDMKNAKIKHKQIVSYTTVDGVEEKYDFDGDINELVLKLTKIKLQSLEIKTKTVEDEFIKYYEEESENA